MSRMYFLGNSTRTQMFGCVIKTENKTIVIDGGTRGDSLQLAELIKQISNSYVDAWFFTHPHLDHIGAFLELYKNNPDIEIETIFSNFPTSEMMKEYGFRKEDELNMLRQFEYLISNQFCQKSHRLQKDEVFEFEDIKINVLRVFNENITRNFINNSSSVFRIDSFNKKVLILGDLGQDGGKDVMNLCSAESLFADYTQLSHHGQDGVSKEFYEYIRPQRCLWPTPEWLWNNDKGNGFNTGPFQTIQTREWMRELGVTEHIVGKDGTTIIQL